MFFEYLVYVCTSSGDSIGAKRFFSVVDLQSILMETMKRSISVLSILVNTAIFVSCTWGILDYTFEAVTN